MRVGGSTKRRFVPVKLPTQKTTRSSLSGGDRKEDPGRPVVSGRVAVSHSHKLPPRRTEGCSCAQRGISKTGRRKHALVAGQAAMHAPRSVGVPVQNRTGSLHPQCRLTPVPQRAPSPPRLHLASHGHAPPPPPCTAGWSRGHSPFPEPPRLTAPPWLCGYAGAVRAHKLTRTRVELVKRAVRQSATTCSASKWVVPCRRVWRTRTSNVCVHSAIPADPVPCPVANL